VSRLSERKIAAAAEAILSFGLFAAVAFAIVRFFQAFDSAALGWSRFLLLPFGLAAGAGYALWRGRRALGRWRADSE
jgi:hypothetical protein